MFDRLAAMAYGLIVFGIIIIIGSVLLTNFGNSVGGTSNTTAAYLVTNFGSTSGGLASWTPALIALGIGLLFLGAFNLGGGKRS
jgi:hypothetical protein